MLRNFTEENVFGQRGMLALFGVIILGISCSMISAGTLFADENPENSGKQKEVSKEPEEAQPSTKKEEAPEKSTVFYLIKQTNEYRKRHNLPPLKANKKLNKACQEFAKVMARTGRMSHYADGRSPSSRVTAAGYSWSSVAENIAYRWDRKSLSNEKYAKATLTQWINSNGHRRNLLNSRNTECGAAFATNPETGKTFSVMVYAKP